MFKSIFTFSCLLSFAAAVPSLADSGHNVATWYHPRDHFAHKLFARQVTGTPGSAEWKAQYPDGSPASLKTAPKKWMDALAAAENAGLIPKIPQSVEGKYDKSVSPASPEVCSSTVQCRAPEDIWDTPPGIVALSFDDGPTEATPQLLQFLKQHNQKVTHFLNGMKIRELVPTFMTAFEQGNDMASHTYSHRYLTSLSNEEVVTELGWTSQIIYDLTGGRVIRYFRPPFGDSDNRIRAIAKYVFGLQQIQWNFDTDDFKLDSNATFTHKEIQDDLDKWLAGPKSPGLNILEHELSANTVKVFMDFYPKIAKAGWVAKSIPEALGTNYYLNAADNKGPAAPLEVGQGTKVPEVPSSTSAVAVTTNLLAQQTTGSASPASATNKSSSSSPTIASGFSYISYLTAFFSLFLVLSS